MITRDMFRSEDTDLFETTAADMQSVAVKLRESLAASRDDVVPLCKSFVVHSTFFL